MKYSVLGDINLPMLLSAPPPANKVHLRFLVYIEVVARCSALFCL